MFGVVLFTCVRDVRVCMCAGTKGLKEKLECVESVNFDSNFFVVGLHQKELKICYS